MCPGSGASHDRRPAWEALAGACLPVDGGLARGNFLREAVRRSLAWQRHAQHH